jgi:CheY-like chemotaxis protein
VGEGSVFTLFLPVSGPGPGAAASKRKEGAVQLSLPAVASPGGSERKLVLVVDDDPRDASLIAGFLSKEGYDAMTAFSGKEALRLAVLHRPFAITLDVVMPDMDGWEVLGALKENPSTAAIPVIIVSMAEDRETGLALGAIGVVSKPVDPDALLAEVRRVAPQGRASVLVVDDQMADRRLMTGILESDGLEVREARDGRECLEMLHERAVDVVTLDLVMPGMGGFEVLEHLRQDPVTRHLPVIIVTAHDLSAKEREALKGTVVSVVEKSRLASGDLLHEVAQILERIGKKPSTRARHGNRILLVEDSEPAIIQIRMVLAAEGYDVDVARNGEEALVKMEQAPPDGIILDLMMPGMDGLTVLDRMRGTPATATTPVLILTAKDLTPEDLHRLSSNNVQQLIQKGDVDRSGLLEKVRRLLRRESKTERKASETPPSAPSFAGAPGAAVVPKRNPRMRAAGAVPRILAVEDNPDNMATLRAILKERGTLLEARDGEEGLAVARTALPDLILLDMSLPRMDGATVVALLRMDPTTRDIPVVALTAHAMKGDRERLLAAGCDDYLSKPLDVHRLLELVERWLDQAGRPEKG